MQLNDAIRQPLKEGDTVAMIEYWNSSIKIMEILGLRRFHSCIDVYLVEPGEDWNHNARRSTSDRAGQIKRIIKYKKQ